MSNDSELPNSLPPSFTPPAGRGERPRLNTSDQPQRVSARKPASSPAKAANSANQPEFPPSYQPAHSVNKPVSSAPPARQSNSAQNTNRRPAATNTRSTAPQQPKNTNGQRPPASAGKTSQKKRRRRTIASVVAVLLIAVLAWPVGLIASASKDLHEVSALSSAPASSGTTYLIAGSDSRDIDAPPGTSTDARTDTIMVLHKPKKGPVALISITRDSYVDIPGHNPNKINASYAFGGPELLVETVEQLTGYKVNHYVEVGFGGVQNIVDAVGGVELCLDQNVSDEKSELEWEAGCHLSDGKTALAFSRMRYADKQGDIGRGNRQRQVISAVAAKIKEPSILLSPSAQKKLLKAGIASIAVSEGTGVTDLAKLAFAFSEATGKDGITGTPPIISLNYRPGKVGSAVQLDPDNTDKFFDDIAAGRLPAGIVGGMPN